MNGFNNRAVFSVTETDPSATPHPPPPHQIKLPRLPSHSPLHLAFSHRRSRFLCISFLRIPNKNPCEIPNTGHTREVSVEHICVSLRSIDTGTPPLFVHLCFSLLLSLWVSPVNIISRFVLAACKLESRPGKDWFMSPCSPLTGPVLWFYVSWWGWGQRLITKVPFLSTLCSEGPDVRPH